MKIGNIVRPNQKGQIVIPKEMRDALAIDASAYLQLVLRGHGIYIYPVEHIGVKDGGENLYPKILEKTQGAWSKEKWSNQRKKRRQVELKASEKRKLAW